MRILGIETSCDETAAAVYDTTTRTMLSSDLFSQLEEHKQYGGVVPEIASRSQLEKIDTIIEQALTHASMSLSDIDAIAVTNRPGLVGSLLVGISFAKALAWSLNKSILAINHLEGHIFSSFLNDDGSYNSSLHFPFICLSASGGHTALYLVHDFGRYEIIGQTIDDAAGELFDKVAKMLGYNYPGGATIERLAQEINFIDTCKYPRTKRTNKEIFFSFSGIKTAVLYDLVKKGLYDLEQGPLQTSLNKKVEHEVASSLLVCVTDIFEKNIVHAIKQYPNIQAFTFVGGVSCNQYMKNRFAQLAKKHRKNFYASPFNYATDNAAMIAFVGGYKAEKKEYSDLHLDVFKE